MAVTYLREALTFCTTGYPNLSTYLNNLANVLAIAVSGCSGMGRTLNGRSHTTAKQSLCALLATQIVPLFSTTLLMWYLLTTSSWVATLA
jgi:hypothetical protein